MIKFFRHIRKDLMDTGKTGKYLKYAMGEISSTINWLSVSNIQAKGFIEYSNTVLDLIEQELDED